jgi:hypothetical protein
MKRMSKLIGWTIQLLLWLRCVDAIEAQPVGGIPEPSLVLYGAVRNAGNQPIVAGNVRWEFRRSDNTTLTNWNSLADLGDGLSYLLEVPLETVIPPLVRNEAKLQIDPTRTLTRRAFLNNEPLTISGDDSFNLSAADRGRTQRIDLSLGNAPTDSDRDGMPDTWEIFHGLNPNFNDAALDKDHDGWSNLQEYQGKGNGDPSVSNRVYHSADFQHNIDGNDVAGGDFTIDLTEVLELVDLWRADEFHFAPWNDAGLLASDYSRGPGNRDGPRHSADYEDPPWVISLAEALDGIEIWRQGRYAKDDLDVEGDGYKPTSLGALHAQGTLALSSASADFVATHSGPSAYQAGTTLAITNTATFSGKLTQLGITVTLPENWTFSDSPVKGSGSPTRARNEILFQDFNLLSPVECIYEVVVPPGETGEKSIRDRVLYKFENGTRQAVFAAPDPMVLRDLVNPVNQAPVAAISTPRSGDSFTLGGGVPIAVNASDPDGSVARVRILVDGSEVLQLSQAPFSGTWTPSAAGNFDISAIAYDNLDKAGIPVSVRIVILPRPIDQAPTSFVAAPANGAVYGLHDLVIVSAKGTDPEGQLASLALFINGIKYAESGTSPILRNWRPQAPGRNVFRAEAKDIGGQTGVSEDVIVTVKNADTAPTNTPPWVSIIPYFAVVAGATTTSIPFEIDDKETPLTNLVVRASVTVNAHIIPQSAVSVSGEGRHRMLRVAGDELNPSDTGAVIQVEVIDTGGLSARSGNAALVVTHESVPGPSYFRDNTYFRLRSVTCEPGGSVRVPIEVGLKGNEGGISFQMWTQGAGFYPFRLEQIDLPTWLGDFVVITNRIGATFSIAVAAPPGGTLPPGTRDLVQLTLSLPSVVSLTRASLGDLRFNASDADGQPLVVNTHKVEQLTIGHSGYEGDISPVGAPDGRILSGDWVRGGLLAAGIAKATRSEFQRADCAPLVKGGQTVLGDGVIDIADWVQIGRFLLGLDRAELSGGPLGEIVELDRASSLNPRSRSAVTVPAVTVPAVVSIVPDTESAGTANAVIVQLQSSGDVNALGFSLNFGADDLVFVRAQSSLDPNVQLIVNTNRAMDGVVGIVVSGQPNTTLPSGTAAIARLEFDVYESFAEPPFLQFSDAVVARKAVSITAEDVPVSFVDGSVPIAVVTAGLAPEILQGPVPQTILEGGSVTFAVNAEGSSPLRYQWLYEGLPIEDARGPILALQQVPSGLSGLYAVTVTNRFGVKTSDAVHLDVVKEVHLIDVRIASDGLLIFTIAGGHGLTYAIEMSEDLVRWIQSRSVASSGAVTEFTESLPIGARALFYRIRLEP